MGPSKLLHGSLLGLMALGPACKKHCDDVPPAPDRHPTGEGQPPRLISGEFKSADVVQLAFSEPLAPVDAVDPEKFRLGIVALEIQKHDRGDNTDYYGGPGVGGAGGAKRLQCKRYVHYCDLTVELDDCIGHQSSSYYYYGDVGGTDPSEEGATRVVALELDDGDASLLELRIDPPIDEDLCLELEYADSPTAMHVFFSSADLPTIEDRDGEELAEIAPHWVASRDETTERDDFEALKHWQPIPCPKHF